MTRVFLLYNAILSLNLAENELYVVYLVYYTVKCRESFLMYYGDHSRTAVVLGLFFIV
jgi:hypothetical protein